MRNLKKILALVMALVMSMSLVTIANAADFTDNDDISYEEAADVMNAIGVIEGFEDGSFDPHGTLTREQAAKLVTYMLLGDNAERLGIERSTFDDVAMTRWSAPAIEYCVSLGIIDGAGDGNFYPRGQLTAVAFAKVLLTALGYDADAEGLVGTAWSINTSALAAEVGLDDGIEDLVWSAAITREQAAQMALNTIKAPLVAYENDVTIVVGDTPVSFGSGDAYYITTTLAREQRISDEQLSNSNDYTVEFGERYFPNLRLIREADEFERPSHTWTYNGAEIGSYTDYDLQVATYTEAITGRTLYDLLGRSTIEEYSIAYYVDGAESDTIKESNMIRTNTRDYATTGNGVLTQVFVDHTNEEITITSVNTYLAVADADYNESRGELSLTVYQSEANPDGVGKTVDVEDIDTITEYTEGDFMLVNMAAVGTTGDKMEVVRVNDVESMEDCTVTRYSKGSSVTVDGEAYDYAQKSIYKDDVLDQYNQGYLDNYTYTFYLDQYGYVIGAEIYEGEANYLFLTGYDMNGSNLSVTTATAAAIFLDGEMTEIRVDVSDTNENIEDYNSDTTGTAYDYVELSHNGNWSDSVDGESEYNRWFRYTVDENNVYTLTPAEHWVNEKAIADGQEINSANVRVGTGSNRAYGNDASIYITVDTGDVDLTTTRGITKVNGIYTGVQEIDLQVDSTTANNLREQVGIFALYDDDGYIIAAVIVGDDMNNSQNYAYILDTEAQEEYTENGDTFWDVEAIVDNELVTLTVEDYGNTINKIQREIHDERGAMYRVTYNSDGHVIEAELCHDQEFGEEDPTEDDYVYGNLVRSTVGDTAGRYDYNGRDIDPDIDSVYNVENVDHEVLNLKNRTLYIGDTNDYGLFLASGANIFVVQYETDSNSNRDLTVESYTNASAALNSLKNDEDFSGSISAVLSDAGTAEYLVINSDDDIGLVTDDGTSARGNVPTEWDGSSADVDYTIASNGRLRATFTYNVPEHIADGSEVELSIIVSENGDYYDTINSRRLGVPSGGDFSIGTVRDGKVTFTYTSGAMEYYGVSELSFEIYDEGFDRVKIAYTDMDDNNISNLLDMDRTTDALDVTGGTAADISIRLKAAGQNGTADVEFENTSSDVATTITFANSAWTAGTGRTAVDDSDYVYVRLNVDDLDGMTTTYSITGLDDTLGDLWGSTGNAAVDAMTIDIQPASATVSEGANVAWNTQTFDTLAATVEAGVEITFNTGDTITVLNNNTPTTDTIRGLTDVTADFALEITDVELLPDPEVFSVEFVDANWNNTLDDDDQLVITFEDALRVAPTISGSAGSWSINTTAAMSDDDKVATITLTTVDSANSITVSVTATSEDGVTESFNIVIPASATLATELTANET